MPWRRSTIGRDHQVRRFFCRQARMINPTGDVRAHGHLPVSVIRAPWASQAKGCEQFSHSIEQRSPLHRA